MSEEKMTDEELRLLAQKKRNVQIGLLLGGLITFFFILSMFKFMAAFSAA